jgi:excisionase family DNA binding protein
MRMFSVSESTEVVGCGPNVIYDAIRAGRLRAVRLGRKKWRIREDWLWAWVERAASLRGGAEDGEKPTVD